MKAIGRMIKRNYIGWLKCISSLAAHTSGYFHSTEEAGRYERDKTGIESQNILYKLIKILTFIPLWTGNDLRLSASSSYHFPLVERMAIKVFNGHVYCIYY